MIPNIIHYIYGLEENFGGKPFSFINYLAVLTASVLNSPQKIYFHYHFEPVGYWWDKAKELLTLKRIEQRNVIFGNKLIHYAHKADVARLEILMKYGGIYLDIDVICVNSFNPLLEYDCVLGREENVGLCNAVILCKANSEFISRWYDSYKFFEEDKWNYHSVKLPQVLARRHLDEIHIVDEYSFFYPTNDDIVSQYLWKVSDLRMTKRTIGALRKLKRKIWLMNFDSSMKLVLHSFYSRKWHYKKLSQSFCIHLWETNWWHRYLLDITPKYILEDDSNFPKLIRSILQKNDNLRKIDY
ncbi:MAG: glycosyltransferase [Ignavibacteriaceae bacterium]|jgi:hypothetical protein